MQRRLVVHLVNSSAHAAHCQLAHNTDTLMGWKSRITHFRRRRVVRPQISFFCRFDGVSPMSVETAEITISAEQLRGARAMLGWSRTQLAQRSRVSIATIADFDHRTFRQLDPQEFNHRISGRGRRYIGLRLYASKCHEFKDFDALCFSVTSCPLRLRI